MTTPSEKAIEDITTLRSVAKISGRSPGEVIKLLSNPNMDIINDPNNPFREMGKS